MLIQHRCVFAHKHLTLPCMSLHVHADEAKATGFEPGLGQTTRIEMEWSYLMNKAG